LRRFAEETGEDGRLVADAIAHLNRLDSNSSAGLAAIDRERRKMLARNEPLVDGTRGEPRPWDVGLTVADACRDSKKPRPALLLYWLVRLFRPRRVIEFGSNVGVSAAYIGTALRENGDGGQLWTLDGSAYRQRLAKQTIENVGLSDIVHFEFGEFIEILPRVLADNGPFDCAFIDGNHTLEPTLEFTRMVLDHAEVDPLVMYDDIRWSPGMKEAWRRLRKDSRMQSAADLYSVGVCRMTRRPARSRHVTKPLMSVLYGPEPVLTV
jgi:predicted O-methyltransferase YrrM